MKNLTLLQFFGLLPGIDKSAAREMIGDGLTPFIIQGAGGRLEFRDTYTAHAVTIYREDLVSLGINGRVDSHAAKALLSLYSAGALPMNDKKRPTAPAKAQAYAAEVAAAEAAAAAAIAKEAEQCRAAARRRRAIIEEPSLATEDDFSLQLLNDIFLHHNGPGGGSMEIGGLVVTKSTPVPYSSNSGKNRFWSYSYTWTSADGESRIIDQRSAFEGNRRNDANRNWGLGRD